MTSPDPSPAPDPAGAPSGRPPWLFPALIGLAVVAAAIVVLVLLTGDDGDSSEVEAGAASERLVVSLQTDLQALGYYDGPIDGVYGSGTTDAVRALQTDLGVPADGRYGPETHAALQSALADVESETVKEIQRALTDTGYYDGPIDGQYGPATVEAVIALQVDLDVEPDGIVGPETIAAFEREYGSGGGSTTTTTAA